MNTTSIGLLDRLKQAKPDSPDWGRLQEIYRPLIRSRVAHFPELLAEAEDVTQAVFEVLVRELPDFERERDGSFRAWLRKITVNRIWTFLKARRKQPPTASGGDADRLLEQLQAPDSDPSRQWDCDHDRYVVQKLLALVQPDFEPKTWRAFADFGLQGRPADDVARELGISVTSVVQAKSRVLKRLRDEGAEMME